MIESATLTNMENETQPRNSQSTLKDQHQAIVELGIMVFELSFRVHALEAILQKKGLLSSEEIEKTTQAIQAQFLSVRSQDQAAYLEKLKKQVHERALEILVRFEGPPQ